MVIPTPTDLQFHLVFTLPALAATLGTAAYLWVVDRIAIGLGTRQTSADLTTGVTVLGLPIEEMYFFVAAGLMTVNGLVLLERVFDRHETQWSASSGRHGTGIERHGTAVEPDVELDPVDD